jgi:hypothetical protein
MNSKNGGMEMDGKGYTMVEKHNQNQKHSYKRGVL